ncbi:MAG: UDP-N-acetylmuramoyl-tripeptide--D-alanyl-D-alanine ligase [Bdellovibrionales bacterium]|nr:UDP-N-acetylmuramoyl-tripeptide--D-alanyl-D-alanine ligase [Bdellovibrionales bacterium]
MKSELRISQSISSAILSEVFESSLDRSWPEYVRGVSLDSRTLQKGDLFFAIEGQRDGHDFVKNAKAKGACGAVVARKIECDLPQILVQNPLKALSDLANWHRRSWGKEIIAITGSSGKTTCKEMMGYMLGDRTWMSKGSWNNHLGVPLTLLGLEDHHDAAVIEMGMNHSGEIKALTKIAQPNYGMITNVGRAHIEFFSSVEKIASAKQELFDGLGESDTAIIRLDDPWIRNMKDHLSCKVFTVSQKEKADLYVTSKIQEEGATQITLQTANESRNFLINKEEQYEIDNFIACVALWISIKKTIMSLPEKIFFPAVSQRFEVFHHSLGFTYIDDCYNANPDSVRASLTKLKHMEAKRRIFVFGDMGELGSSAAMEHEKLAEELQDYRIDRVFFAGKFNKDFYESAVHAGFDAQSIFSFEDKDEMMPILLNQIQKGDVILVKASSTMAYSSVITQIREIK